MKKKGNIFSQDFFIWKNWIFFLSYLDSHFGLVSFFQLIFTIFRLVPKTCYNWVSNPSWDAIQWHNIRGVKKIIKCHHRGEIHVLPLLGEFCHRILLHFEHFAFAGLGVGFHSRTSCLCHVRVLDLWDPFTTGFSYCKLISTGF
jgi:hypothetical protein